MVSNVSAMGITKASGRGVFLGGGLSQWLDLMMKMSQY